MKKLSILLFSLFLVMTTVSSCSDDDVKDAIDCFGERLLFTLEHVPSAENPQHIDFTMNYFGDHSLDSSINWNFGDGTPAQNVTGTTTSHTYGAPGSYTVVAKVSLNNGGCPIDITRTINVE